MSTRSKRICQVCAVLLLLGVVLFTAQPVYLVVSAWLRDRHDRQPTPAGFVDDASRMNETRVAEVWAIPPDILDAEAQLQKLLERARRERLPVSIAGARHSMGGHTIAPDGMVIDMLPFKHMELNREKSILRVGAGATWVDILPYLDARGMSVGVMQSNNNFTVGGSVSVNCHGWQCRAEPISSTVESFRLMKADGEVVRCSRSENNELFRLALGGYGLFGIILDVDLRVVPNERYRSDAEILHTKDYVSRFQKKVHGEVGMVYGRLCIVPGEKFLSEAILTVFERTPGEIPPLKAGLTHATVRREVFRAQIGSIAGKELRWKAETKLGETGKSAVFSRNQLFHESAEVYQEQNRERSDILHEYFIPVERFEDFLTKARSIVPKYSVDLLNVTVRDVREDRDTFLRYADRDMFGFVMLFNHPRTAAADAQMEAFTQKMIDAALECGGRYYLPYRLHATQTQLHQAYPMARDFFAKKRQYDPDGIFVNRFWLKYAE